MLRFLKQIGGPTVFSKGLTQYKQHQYGIAKQLFVKAAQWMPSLHSSALYQAVVLLCDHHLSRVGSTDQFQAMLDALNASPHKDSAHHTAIAADIKNIIDSIQ